jgi:hypothetical protein
MKRVIYKVQAIVFSCLIIAGCSKSGNALTEDPRMDRIEAANPVLSIPPAPMPPDSSELDSLNRPPFN